MAIVGFTFLGQPVTGGVSRTMARVLEAVEADLATTWENANSDEDFATWAGLVEPVIGYRSGAGLHGSGSAVDLNVTTAPYFVTRTGGTLGGEAAAASQTAMRRRAVEVCDRAMAFGEWTATTADLSIRKNDSIEVTYDRFREVSDALVYYFAGTISSVPLRVNRAPIPDVESLPDGDPAFGAIGPAELAQGKAQAVAGIEQVFGYGDWQATHPDWPYTPEQQNWQILRDYEMVRTPMLHGNPARPVVATRNPARGFLPLRRELVCAMIRVGDRGFGGGNRTMRWGASDFGAQQSGDIMHFDLGRATD